MRAATGIHELCHRHLGSSPGQTTEESRELFGEFVVLPPLGHSTHRVQGCPECKVGRWYPFCCRCGVTLDGLAAELKNDAAIHTHQQATPLLRKTFNPKSTATDNSWAPLLWFPFKITIGFSAGGKVLMDWWPRSSFYISMARFQSSNHKEI